jgi:ribosome-associated translation inhibitor RaiA
MNFDVTFRQIRPRDEVRERATTLYKKLARFLDASSEGKLTVAVERGQAILELVVHDQGETHKVTQDHEDLRTAIDKIFHTAEVQMRRAKERRLSGRHSVPDDDGFEAEV